WGEPIPVLPSPERGWRTRAAFHLSQGPGPLSLGFYEEGSHRVVDIEVCLQLSESMMRAALGLLHALEKRRALLSPLRGIDLAESDDGKELVAVLIVQGAPGVAASLAGTAAEVEGLTGFGVANESDSSSFVP